MCAKTQNEVNSRPVIGVFE